MAEDYGVQVTVRHLQHFEIPDGQAYDVQPSPRNL